MVQSHPRRCPQVDPSCIQCEHTKVLRHKITPIDSFSPLDARFNQVHINVVVEAHCYVLQCTQIDCEQIRSRINQQLIAGHFGHKGPRQLCTKLKDTVYDEGLCGPKRPTISC